MKSIKSVLESLVRYDTHDEAKKFTDTELKNAADIALKELCHRGWEVNYVRGLYVRKRQEL